MADREVAVMALNVVAAKAKKLAHDVEKGKLWEGEFGSAIAEIRKQLDDAGRSGPR